MFLTWVGTYVNIRLTNRGEPDMFRKLLRDDDTGFGQDLAGGVALAVLVLALLHLPLLA